MFSWIVRWFWRIAVFLAIMTLAFAALLGQKQGPADVGNMIHAAFSDLSTVWHHAHGGSITPPSINVKP